MSQLVPKIVLSPNPLPQVFQLCFTFIVSVATAVIINEARLKKQRDDQKLREIELKEADSQ
jgi:hypothetical protein